MKLRRGSEGLIAQNGAGEWISLVAGSRESGAAELTEAQARELIPFLAGGRRRERPLEP